MPNIPAGDEHDSTQSPTTFALRSSWLTSGEYDPATQTLTVFTRSGHEYTHSNVEPEVVTGLITADSPGGYYTATIKGRY